MSPMGAVDGQDRRSRRTPEVQIPERSSDRRASRAKRDRLRSPEAGKQLPGYDQSALTLLRRRQAL